MDPSIKNALQNINVDDLKHQMQELSGIDNFDLNDIEINYQDMGKDDVIISIPKIYPGEENCESETIISYRVISLKKLVEIAKLGLQIENSISTQHLVTPLFLEYVNDPKAQNTISLVSNLKNQLSSITDLFSTQEVYDNCDFEPINLDRIRKFSVLDDGSSFSFQDSYYSYKTVKNEIVTVQAYSLLPELEYYNAKMQNNASDYTESLYIIEMFKQSVQLKPNRTLSYGLQNLNVFMFFLALFGASRPLVNNQFSSYLSHFMLNSLDILIRSRYYSVWENSKFSKYMKNELQRNESILVNAIDKAEGCRVRYNSFHNIFKRFISYDDYVNQINKFSTTFKGKKYYFFESTALKKILSLFAEPSMELVNEFENNMKIKT